MHHLCRFWLPDHGERLGLIEGDRVYDLSANSCRPCTSLTTLLCMGRSRELYHTLASFDLRSFPSLAQADLFRPPDDQYPHFLPPVDFQEVWGAGVTYRWDEQQQEQARRERPLYAAVYEAERPLLFFKSPAGLVAGPEDWIGLRADSLRMIPEAELAILVNPWGEIVGLGLGNDVTALDIESTNPLYQPQAKVFEHSCALGPYWLISDREGLFTEWTISCTVWRSERRMLAQAISLAAMRRSLDDLANQLYSQRSFPTGAVLLTGAGAGVPPGFTLQEGDQVVIECPALGRMRNRARLIVKDEV